MNTISDSTLKDGWRVIPFSGSFKHADERWEVYDPNGDGGAVYASDVRDQSVYQLLDALSAAQSVTEREQAEQQKSATAALFDPSRLPARDEDGRVTHPDYSIVVTTDDEVDVTPFFTAHGLELRAVGEEFPENCAHDSSLFWFTPEPPAGEGWRLVSIYDNEDGEAVALYCRRVTPQPSGSAVDALGPIERDEAYDRTYIPLPGGWEVQTKGKGSTFRIAGPGDERLPICPQPYLFELLEKMARDIHREFSAIRTQSPCPHIVHGSDGTSYCRLAESAGPSPAQAPAKVKDALTLLDIGQGFALCNTDHAGTRRDVEKLRPHIDVLLAYFAKPTPPSAEQ